MAVSAGTPLRWQTPGPVKGVPYDKFLPLLQAGVAAAPNRSDLKVRLAQALINTSQMAEIVGWLRPVVADDSAAPELLYYLGRAALATRDDRLALDALRSSAAKGFAGAFGYLAEALIRLDRADEALQAGLQALEHSPSDFAALPIVVRVLLDRNEAERLWALCIDLRARGARVGFIPAAMAIAAAILGRDDQVAELVGPSPWFSAKRLGASEDFNQRLAAEILGHTSLGPLPATKATSGTGARINRLDLAGGSMAQNLLVRVRQAVDAYLAERQGFSNHLMMTDRPDSVELRSWALVVHDDGHEDWHIHPSGWISGVYYVRVPKVAAHEGHPGAFEFGPYPFGRERHDFRWPRWHATPEAGLLLLFPSYYAHRTWPTGVSDPRICVAFDIRPS
jgi:tetratricopeptide (TPR) repeat protein